MILGSVFLLLGSPGAPARTLDSPRLEIRAAPIVDLHFFVRALAAGKQPVPDLAGLEEAVEAAGALDRELGNALAWGPIEGLLGDCETAADALAALSGVPETFEVPSGKKVELRAGALRLAEALAKAEPAFLEKVWPAHRDEIEAVRRRIASEFDPKAPECLAYVAEHLALDAGDVVIPVHLVAEAPFPGAVTQRDDAGRGVCFVGVRAAEGTQLFETILHEATHALDVAAKAGSVLDDLRARLEKAGFTRKDRAWRDVPHTLMFVQAGETIRRIVDPRHEHYGVVARYYAKVQAIADAEVPAWTAYLDGKSTRDEALVKIVASVAAEKSR